MLIIFNFPEGLFEKPLFPVFDPANFLDIFKQNHVSSINMKFFLSASRRSARQTAVFAVFFYCPPPDRGKFFSADFQPGESFAQRGRHYF